MENKIAILESRIEQLESEKAELVEAIKEVEEIMTVKELQLLSNNSFNALLELSRIKGKVTL